MSAVENIFLDQKWPVYYILDQTFPAKKSAGSGFGYRFGYKSKPKSWVLVDSGFWIKLIYIWDHIDPA